MLAAYPANRIRVQDDKGGASVANQQELLTQFEQTRLILTEFINSRNAAERAAPSNPDDWVARDVVTLCGFWMKYMVDRMAYFERGSPAPRDVDFDALNQQALAAEAGRTWGKVAASALTALAGLVDAVARVSDAILLLPNSYDESPGGPLWGEVQANGFIWPLQEMEKYCRRYGDDAQAESIHAALVGVTGEPEISVCEHIAPQALRELGDAPIIIDVRDAADFAAGHLPGAHHIPLAQLADRAATLPQDRPIVTYCNMHHPGQSRGERAAALLTAQGLAAQAIEGGLPAWQRAGYPIATGQTSSSHSP